MEEEDEEEFFCMLKWFLDAFVAMEICFLISSVVTHTHTLVRFIPTLTFIYTLIRCEVCVEVTVCTP